MASKKAFAMGAACALFAAWTLPSAGQGAGPIPASNVRVEYVHPENFIDVGNRYFSSVEVRIAYLEELGKHLAARASARLQPGQRLTVSITEVDMAGGFEPWGTRTGNARVIRDIYPPRIDLRFSLAGTDGAVLREGERKLRDQTFMTAATSYSSDPLRYEKALLDAWIDREFQRSGT